ncbi:hypothetical protein BGW36DRAFT_396432 [Talaromyces proteolyticus]|uniref:NAD-dependent epimerase/dehydratase domain-containing protein n=1 Tax=Talaromyces proteolyticus TaxID=1131652 RepID=A0AAD4KRC4_9EURO|nr:uncharacterized protein BGW36DRAFT_396432 [Talaromyces proteolyticus]KAH8698720.1 hypothetical protein BGW36DRAFT_396432 [Talaromyces proteolyticus]
MKVLVTGANGFYAGAVMDRLVQLGIDFHGTVRSGKSVAPLKQRYGDSITIFIVPDICNESAFVESIKGCDAVLHIASPFTSKMNDAKDFLDPAIKGALSALQSAAKTPSVKRVVMTSSASAMIDPQNELGFFRPGYTYTENDWNPLTYETASKSSAFSVVYTASKALAERAAWDFMEKEPRSFDLVCINPAHTWGEYSQYVPSPESMNKTNSDLSKLIDGKQEDVPAVTFPWMTDIGSVADAHIAALLRPEANGRYIVATESMDFQQVVETMHTHFPQAEWIKNVPKGKTGERKLNCFRLDNSKSRRDLGLTFPPVEKAIIDFCRKYQEDRKAWL